MMTEPVIITHVDDGWIGSAAKGFLRHSGQPAGSDGLAIYYHSVVRDAKRFRAAQVPVRLDIDTPGRGKAHVLRIVPTIVQSYIVRGSRGWLELNSRTDVAPMNKVRLWDREWRGWTLHLSIPYGTGSPWHRYSYREE